MAKDKDTTKDDQEQILEPGTVISPRSTPNPPAPKTASPVTAVLPPTPTPQPKPPVTAVLPPTPTPEPEPTPTPKPEESSIPTGLKPPESSETEKPTERDAVTWTASEFIAHDKSASWYTGLVIGAAVGAVLIYLVTKDFVSVAVVIVAAILLGIYGSHNPRQLEYRVDQSGVSVGNKHYGYDGFKSFSVMPEGAFSSISLMPLKRFSPIITIYYAPEHEEKILASLSAQLPNEVPRRDAVDGLMRRIRF